jgi:AbrB family looped-hinge helix DNA binding protein
MSNALVREKGQITIPAAVREEAEIEAGDCLVFVVRGKGEFLVRIVQNGNGNGKAANSPEVELPEEMVQRIERALGELDAGLVTRYETDDDFLASLDD